MDNVNGMDRRLSSLRSELESANDLVRDWSYTTAVISIPHRANAAKSIPAKCRTFILVRPSPPW